jgi:hypothetical protein
LATHISTFVAMHFSFSGSRSLFGHGQEAEGGVDDRLKNETSSTLHENLSTSSPSIKKLAVNDFWM